MASSKLMDEINEQFLLCKICFEILKKPKSLACMHTFCSDCIEKHMNAEQERSSFRYSIYSRNVSCPICRRKTDLPTGGVRRLPDNFLLSSLTDVIVSKTSDDDAPLCEICTSGSENNNGGKGMVAVSKCLDCNKLMCKNCVEVHQKTKVTQNHDLYDMDVEKDIQCKEHEGETVRYYCEPCQMCVCVVCTFQDHKDHDVSSFNEGISKNKMALEGLVEQSREKLKIMKEKLDLIMNCENNVKDAEEQIHDLSTAFTAVIRNREQQLVEEVNEVFGIDTLQYLERKSDLEDVFNNLEKTTNLTELMIKDKGIEIILLNKEIQGKLKNLLQYDIADVPENVNKRVRFMHGTLNFGDLCVSTGGDDASSPDDWDIYEHLRQLQFTKSVQTDFASTCDSTTTMGCDLKGGMVDRNMQTRLYKMVEKDTNTDKKKIENKSNMTDPPSLRNVAVLTDEMKTGTAVTQTERTRTADMEILCKPHVFTIDTQTVLPSGANKDKHTMTNPVETKEKHTFTFIPTLESGTNPDACDFSSKPETSEKETFTELLFRKNASTYMEEITTRNIGVSVRRENATTGTTMTSLMETRHVESMTSSTESHDVATCTKTIVTDTQGTHTDITEVTDVGIATDEKESKHIGTMVYPETEHKCTEMNAVISSNAQTMTSVDTRDTGTATRQIELSNNETSMPEILTCEQSSETSNCGLYTSDGQTNTECLQTSDAGVATEHEILSTSDIGVNVMLIETTDKVTETMPLDTTDSFTFMPYVEFKTVGLETIRASRTDSANDPILPKTCSQMTETVGVETIENSTFMSPVQYNDVAMETLTTVMTDAGTGTPNVSVLDQFTATDDINRHDMQTGTESVTSYDRAVFVSPDVLDVGTGMDVLEQAFVDNSTSMETVITSDVAVATNADVVVKDVIEHYDSSTETDRIHLINMATETSNISTADNATSTVAPPTAEKADKGTSTVIRGKIEDEITEIVGESSKPPVLKVDRQTMTPRTISLKKLSAFVHAPERSARNKGTMTSQVAVNDVETSTDGLSEGNADKVIKMTSQQTSVAPETSNVMVSAIANVDDKSVMTSAIQSVNSFTTMRGELIRDIGTHTDIILECNGSQTETTEMTTTATGDGRVADDSKSMSTMTDPMQMNVSNAKTDELVSNSCSVITKQLQETKSFQTTMTESQDKNISTLPIVTCEHGTSTNDMAKMDQSTSTPTFVRLTPRRESMKTVMKIDKETNTVGNRTAPSCTTTGTDANYVLSLDKAVGTDSLNADGKFSECISKLKIVNQRLHAVPPSGHSENGVTSFTDVPGVVPITSQPPPSIARLYKQKPFEPAKTSFATSSPPNSARNASVALPTSSIANRPVFNPKPFKPAGKTIETPPPPNISSELSTSSQNVSPNSNLYIVKPKPFKPEEIPTNTPLPPGQKNITSPLPWRKVAFKPPVKKYKEPPVTPPLRKESVVDVASEKVHIDLSLLEAGPIESSNNRNENQITNTPANNEEQEDIEVKIPSVLGVQTSPRLTAQEKRVRNLTITMDKPTFEDLPSVKPGARLAPPSTHEGTPTRDNMFDELELSVDTRPPVPTRPSSFDMALPSHNTINGNDLLLVPYNAEPRSPLRTSFDDDEDSLIVPQTSQFVSHSQPNRNLTTSRESLQSIKSERPTVTYRNDLSVGSHETMARAGQPPLPPKRGMDSHIKTFEYIQSKAVDDLISPIGAAKPLPSLSKDTVVDQQQTVSPSAPTGSIENKPMSPAPPRRSMASHIRTLELREAKAIEELFGDRKPFDMVADVADSRLLLARKQSPRQESTNTKEERPSTVQDKGREGFMLKTNSNKQGTSFTITNTTPGDNDVWAEFENTYRNLEASSPISPNAPEKKPPKPVKEKKQKPPMPPVRGRSLLADLEKMRNQGHGRPLSPSSREKENKARRQILDMTQLLVSPVMDIASQRQYGQTERMRHQSQSGDLFGDNDRAGREMSPGTARIRSKSAERPPRSNNVTRISPKISHVPLDPTTVYGVHVDYTPSTYQQSQHQDRVNEQKKDLIRRAASVEEQVEDVLHELDDIILRSKTRRSLSDNSYVHQQHPSNMETWSMDSDNQPRQKTVGTRHVVESNQQMISTPRTPPSALAKHRVQFKGVSPPRIGAGEVYIDSNYQQVDRRLYLGGTDEPVYDVPSTMQRPPQNLMQELQGAFNRPMKGSGIYMSRAELKKLNSQQKGSESEKGSFDRIHMAVNSEAGDCEFIDKHSQEIHGYNMEITKDRTVDNKTNALQKMKRYFKF